MTSKPQTICPTCKKPDTWHPENKSRPFCSPRCKLIDLGEWANETHAIPGSSVVQQEENDESEKDA